MVNGQAPPREKKFKPFQVQLVKVKKKRSALVEKGATTEETPPAATRAQLENIEREVNNLGRVDKMFMMRDLMKKLDNI